MIYDKQQTDNSITITHTIPNQGDIKDLIDVEKEVSPPKKELSAPYNLNIITDGSGNNTKEIELDTNTNVLNLSSDYTDIYWQQVKAKLIFISSYNENIQILNHNLNGFSLSKINSCLLIQRMTLFLFI